MTLRRTLLLVVLAGTAAVASCAGDTASETSSATTRPLGAAAEAGRTVAQQRGCLACHAIEDGGRRSGPTFIGLAGSTVQLADGSTVTADDDYLRRSITDPNAQRVAGYPTQMPRLPLSDAEIDSILNLLKELA